MIDFVGEYILFLSSLSFFLNDHIRESTSSVVLKASNKPYTHVAHIRVPKQTGFTLISNTIGRSKRKSTRTRKKQMVI